MGKGKHFGVLGALVLCMVLAGPAWAQKTLTNGIDFGFPPFGFVDTQGNPAGFDVESVNWIAEQMGFTVRHQPMDWDGIIPALNANKIDFIASGMSITEERKKVVNFTIPYYQVTQVLVVNEGEETSFDDMFTTGKKIGVQRGTNTHTLLIDMAKEPGKNFDIVAYDSTDLSMQDLPLGRIHGSAMDSSIAREIKKGRPFKVAGTFDVEPDSYGYAVRKADTELLNTLNEGLEKLMADPYWSELKKKWDLE
ncbi:polar amino acid transport system substrate-binding protein [Desulfonatronum thiosulfatophilum]|uniref:Polar amino acid transport system substrate-binding protein n=1 Tax=Desulfonatronum thiosulfatophilum TaxID=617002 RepID=A0A1G6BRB4_9BACT|nr:ABC transporter substrate-binding protein [Desulfonatronum thiosulfatophilum]SDB23173.1 polar amino acid transport system substrate-binding protein [Desulfonatronum thiosulfatophilum]